MYGQNVGSLKIYKKTNATKQIIWGLSGQQSSSNKDWKFGQAPIRSNVVYQVHECFTSVSCCLFYIKRNFK